MPQDSRLLLRSVTTQEHQDLAQMHEMEDFISKALKDQEADWAWESDPYGRAHVVGKKEWGKGKERATDDGDGAALFFD